MQPQECRDSCKTNKHFWEIETQTPGTIGAIMVQKGTQVFYCICCKEVKFEKFGV